MSRKRNENENENEAAEAAAYDRRQRVFQEARDIFRARLAALGAACPTREVVASMFDHSMSAAEHVIAREDELAASEPA